MLDQRISGALFRNIGHYLAAATTSQTDGSAPPMPLSRHAVKRLAGLSERARHPFTSERDQEAAQSTLAEDRPGRRIRPPDGGRWWQMLGHGAKLRHKEAAGNCRAAHSPESWGRRSARWAFSANTLLRWAREPAFEGRGTSSNTGAQTKPISQNQPENHAETVRKTQKPYGKPPQEPLNR